MDHQTQQPVPSVKPAAKPAAKPKTQRTKGWQFDVAAGNGTDPSAVFRAVAGDPSVQYLAHTVDPVSGNIRGVVQFDKPKSNKTFQTGQWQSVGAQGTPMRVTSSTTPTLLGNRVWAYGSLSAGRAPRSQQQQHQQEEHYDDVNDYVY
jgi:hypothetical protein